MTTKFSHHAVNSTKSTGERESFLIKCITCSPELYALPKQNFSVEMQRWDDVRVMNQIDDRTPNLKAKFFEAPKFVAHEVNYQKSSGESEKLLICCITCTQECLATSSQNFSTDMLRWDDYRETLNLQDGTPVMNTLQQCQPTTKKFSFHSVTIKTASGEQQSFQIKNILATAEECGKAHQPVSLEMLRWDDYCLERQNGAPPVAQAR